MRSTFFPTLFLLTFSLPVQGEMVRQQSNQEQLTIQDPAQLVGKRINVRRLPLCEPGTYKGDLEHAGMMATVLSASPSKSPSLPKSALDKMTPEMRDMLLDQQKAALLLLQFEDGAKRDTCAPIGPKRLSDFIELAPGETLAPAVPRPDGMSLAAPNSATEIPELSDDEVNDALRGKGKDHWVWIEDAGLGAAQGARVPSITLYLPEAMLAIRSESARKQFLPYTPTEEERQRALTVIAEGYVDENVLEGCQSITRVVLLSDPSGRVVKEAYLSEPVDDTWRNAFGTTNNCQELLAKFSLTDVQTLRSAALNGEFYVAVFAGSMRTKMYKIKRKHQSKLGLQ